MAKSLLKARVVIAEWRLQSSPKKSSPTSTGRAGNDRFSIICCAVAYYQVSITPTSSPPFSAWRCPDYVPAAFLPLTVPASPVCISRATHHSLRGMRFKGTRMRPPIICPAPVGWSEFSANCGLLTVPRNPLIQVGDGRFGAKSNQFGFDIAGTANIPIAVEACTNLANPVWIPLQSLTLTNGLFYFNEPFQANSSGRYYRISSPWALGKNLTVKFFSFSRFRLPVLSALPTISANVIKHRWISVALL
jgi:hypothetical protein